MTFEGSQPKGRLAESRKVLLRNRCLWNDCHLELERQQLCCLLEVGNLTGTETWENGVLVDSTRRSPE